MENTASPPEEHFLWEVDLQPLNPGDPEIPPECSICREPFNDPPVEVPVRLLFSECQHIFGETCILEHLKSPTPWSNTCPMCRRVCRRDRQYAAVELEDTAAVEYIDPDGLRRLYTQDFRTTDEEELYIFMNIVVDGLRSRIARRALQATGEEMREMVGGALVLRRQFERGGRNTVVIDSFIEEVARWWGVRVEAADHEETVDGESRVEEIEDSQ